MAYISQTPTANSGFFSDIARWFDALAAGWRAAHAYQDLASLSDAALARRGLNREQVARTIFDRHFQ